MHSFDYQKVYSLQDALDAASASKGGSVFMAGGPDLLVQIKDGNCLLKLSEIAEDHFPA